MMCLVEGLPYPYLSSLPHCYYCLWWQKTDSSTQHWNFAHHRVQTLQHQNRIMNTFPFCHVMIFLIATFMGPIWGRQDPGGPHVGPMNFAIWDAQVKIYLIHIYHIYFTANQTINFNNITWLILKYIEAQTKWATFCKQNFQMHFSQNLNKIILKYVPKDPILLVMAWS